MTAFYCPICKAKLQPNPQGFSCSNRHQFDKAKEGYVNLLPVQQKKSKNPGDDPKMVQARRGFLAAGHYQFLQQSVIETISEISSQQCAQTIVDSGCGEGYYTNALADFLAKQPIKNCEVYGIDIAKTAIRYAAKRGPNTHYAVASSHAQPFADNSVDILYKVFAPMAADEIKRVLKPAGYFISVVPGPMHLLQLREKIYNQVTPHKSEPIAQGFKRLSTKNLSKQIVLDKRAEIQHLCEMTPFAWKLPKQVQIELYGDENNAENSKESSVETNVEERAKKLTIDFDFTINIYQQTE